MRYQCNPYYKYISNLVIMYLILRYIMRVNLQDDIIKGISLMSVIVIFILDIITIKDHHLLFFKNNDIEMTEVSDGVYYNTKSADLATSNKISENDNNKHDDNNNDNNIDSDENDEEKSFFVNDIKSIQSENFDNISRTENIYHELNNEFADNGIPMGKHMGLSTVSDKEIVRQIQPYPQTVIKSKAIRPIKF